MAAQNPKIRIFPYAKLLAVQFALFGVLAGLIYSVGGLIFDLATTGSLNWGGALALLALIGMPLIFALGGWIIGLVGGWLFNRFSGRFGSLITELDIFDE